MIYETNKIKLHGLVRSKERANNRFIVKLSIGKDFRILIQCFVREEIYKEMEISKLYEVEGFLVSKDEFNNDLALNLSKVSLTDTYSDRQLVEVMFTITDAGFPRQDFNNPNNKVRDLTVKFHNDNISDVDVEVSLWSKLATFNDIEEGRDAFASCYITISNRTRKLKLIPHYFVILEGN